MLRKISWLASLSFACGTDDVGDTSATTAMTSAASLPMDASATENGEDASDSGDSGDATSDGDATTAAAATTADASSGDTGQSDASASASDTDATSGGDGDGGGAMGGGTIDVTLSGCEIDLGGTVVVSYNGSLGVASVYDDGAYLSGSFQFDQLEVGVIELSSQHRVDTGVVVNLVDTTSTWTNLDAAALAGGVDTISGTITVETWSPARGVSLLHFDAVTLRNVVDGGVCTVDGQIETTELYP